MVSLDYYPRAGWLPNYMRYDLSANQAVQMLMVMRLDAPEPGLVMDMIWRP